MRLLRGREHWMALMVKQIFYLMDSMARFMHKFTTVGIMITEKNTFV